ncbi:MAG: LysR family transcriptional regulator, partial [Acinetobacter sp.]
RKQLSRQVFLRCQHYSTALQILEQYPNAILTIPQNILSHLHVSPLLNIFDVPVQLPQMNIGIYWHKNLTENKRHLFLRSEIYKIFA